MTIALLGRLAPGAIFAENEADVLPVLGATGAARIARVPVTPAAHRLSDLLATTPGERVARAHAAIGRDTLAKIMFTSGSTGAPKAVPMTHGMVAAAAAMSAATQPPTPGIVPRLADWMPWHHVMGGNIMFHRLLRFGGTLTVDPGRPTPGAFARSVEVLRAVCPTHYSGVPAGHAMLADHLDADPAFAERFFGDLWHISYGGAAIDAGVRARLTAASARVLGAPIPVVSGFGATECSGPGILQYWDEPAPGGIGLPMPGVQALLVPRGDGLYELRLRGPNVARSYLGDEAATSASFDEEGFYVTGDAVRLDQAGPSGDLHFAGRLAEDFKLATGTYVEVGSVRLHLLKILAPLLRDAVICGEGRGEIRALAWPSEAGFRSLFGGAPDPDFLARHAAEVERFVADRLAGQGTASSRRVAAVRLLPGAPSAEAGEVTDKGYLNQRRCRETRAAEIAALYAV